VSSQHLTTVPSIRTIWIIRRGSGKAQVHPSPTTVLPGGTLRIKNLTEDPATVQFPPLITPVTKSTVIPAHGEADFTVAPGPITRFLEYDVTFPERHQYAEGNSKPGVIVDG
jgi:hypothetical protein